MFKRIAAIGLIWACAAVAWAILGTTIFSRTHSASTWGAPQEQAPPQITRKRQEVRTIEEEYDGKKRTRKETYQHSDPVKIDGSQIAAALHVDYRQRGLLWFSPYKVDFAGAYEFQNPKTSEGEFAIALPLPAQQAVHDNVDFGWTTSRLPILGKPLGPSWSQDEKFAALPACVSLRTLCGTKDARTERGAGRSMLRPSGRIRGILPLGVFQGLERACFSDRQLTYGLTARCWRYWRKPCQLPSERSNSRPPSLW